MCETSFGQRVKMIRERLGLTQGDLAKRLEIEGDHGRTVQSVSSWENYGKVPSLETIGHLARVLRVSRLWLAWGYGDIENEGGTQGVGFHAQRGRIVPRISAETIVMELSRTSPKPANAFSVHTFFDCGPNAFVLDVTDRSNEPMFQVGDALVIDPDESPAPGDMVLAILGPDNRPVIRRYAQRSNAESGKYVELQALNSAWDSDFIRSPTDGKVVGVMTEHVIPRR